MKQKYCPKCKQNKTVAEFYKDKSRKDNLRAWCKECCRENNKQNEHKWVETRKKYRQTDNYKNIKRNYYSENKKNILASNSEWRQTKKGRLTSYKNGAKIRKISFILTEEEFLSFWNKSCTYCGEKIETIGLDRIDSSIGYEIGNVTSCCSVCNRMKREMSVDDFLKHIEKIQNHR